MTGMVGWPGDFPAGKRPAGIHPWALVGAPPEHREWTPGDPSVEPEIGFGALIDAWCSVDAGMPGLPTTRVGNRTWLQKRVHVGHNARIGVDCEICVGVVICGEVLIGHGVKIGGNTWIKPRVKIGQGAVIGGGSVVTKDVPAHEVWAGSPARFMKLAFTHPDYLPSPQKPFSGSGLPDTHEQVFPPRKPAPVGAQRGLGEFENHPYRDPEEVWEHMRPWHHRAFVHELVQQHADAARDGDLEAAECFAYRAADVTERVDT